ncbi:hypothetical protein BJ741DRAFT_653677 [Chytriomyces cf. hyalinus JEL632]|nr:hypothetical protein BJ741DRAFT_653677 [Chytriomyces cf. hyalinus JEL632]
MCLGWAVRLARSFLGLLGRSIWEEEDEEEEARDQSRCIAGVVSMLWTSLCLGLWMLKMQQERHASPPVPREPVAYKSYIIKNPLGNRMRFVPRTIRELSYIGATKSTLKLFIKDSDFDEAVAKLTSPANPSLPSLFVTADPIQVPEHRAVNLPGYTAPTQEAMEEAFIKRRAVMLEFIMYQIFNAAHTLFTEGTFKAYHYPNPITRTNFKKTWQDANKMIASGDYPTLEISMQLVNQVAARCQLNKTEAKQQVKNFIRDFPIDVLTTGQLGADL